MTQVVSLHKGLILENRYRISKLLAESETTEVYLAEDLRLERDVVVKHLKALYPDPKQAAEQSEQYQSEARLLARLNHPNLIAVLDTFKVLQRPALVAEYVQGSNLQTIIETLPSPVEEEQALEWARQLCHTLEYLHTQKPPVIVRGLQPSNIVLDSNRNLRLVDFGLAKSMDEKGAGTRNIVKGLGEDGFAPLEQGAYSKTDARSDIYSLGAVLYYALTKTIPPSASQRVVSPEDPLKAAKDINSAVSATTSQALNKMMRLRPTERPFSAGEVLDLLCPSSEVGDPEAQGSRHCVDCLIVLETVELDSVEIDRCASCGGIWLDDGELDTLRKKVTEELERSETLLSNLPLEDNHPAMQKIKQNQAQNKSFWSTIAGVFGLSS